MAHRCNGSDLSYILDIMVSFFVKWKDVGMCHPSFHTSIEKHATYQLQRDGGFNILCHTLICLGSYPLRGQYKLLTTPILINLWAMLRGRKGAERDGGDKENREVTTEKNGSCTRVSLVICHSLTLNQDFGAFKTLNSSKAQQCFLPVLHAFLFQSP